MTPEQARASVMEKLQQNGVGPENIQVEQLCNLLKFTINFPPSFKVPQMLDIVYFPEEDGFWSPSVEGNIGYVHYQRRN